MGEGISKVEIKDAFAIAMAAAFGFVIALIWKEVVMAALDLAGIYPQAIGATANPWVGWAIFAVVAVVITVIMIVLILFITKWERNLKSSWLNDAAGIPFTLIFSIAYCTYPAFHLSS